MSNDPITTEGRVFVAQMIRDVRRRENIGLLSPQVPSPGVSLCHGGNLPRRRLYELVPR
jgi:hypothetical protein